MRIGIFIECRPTNGGAFQQSLSTVELLLRSRWTKHEFIVFLPTKQLSCDCESSELKLWSSSKG